MFGVGKGSFGNRGGVRGVLVDKLQRIVGKFSQIALNGLVGTVDGGIERRVLDVDPIAVVLRGTRLHHCIAGQSKIVGIGNRVGMMGGKRIIRRVGRRDTHITVRLGGCGMRTRPKQERQYEKERIWLHFSEFPEIGRKGTK